MKARYILTAAVIIGLMIGSASAYTYTILRGDTTIFPGYSTIIPTDDLRRNSTPQGSCNNGFSPSCRDVNITSVGTIPEPATYVLMLPFLLLFILRKKKT